MDKKRIHELLEHATEAALSEWNRKGTHNVDTKEMGEVVDIIKDLAEAEKAVWEACYYKEIVEAMEEEEEFQEMLYKEGRAGYDRWRTSKGRFAPKGHGHETSMAMATGRYGYDGAYPMPERYDTNMPWGQPWMLPMGYPGRDWDHDGRTTDGSHTSHSEHVHPTGRMGYTPDEKRMMNDTRSEYERAKRYYHESGTNEAKMDMDTKAEEYLKESFGTMRDIFAQADPNMQQRMRTDLANLFREMGGK